MATGMRAKLLKVIANRPASVDKIDKVKRPRCVPGNAKSGAKCSEGAKKEVVTSVGS